MFTIFTDGSSRGNPGPGGWGAIIADNKEVMEIGGAAEHTTNNKMELTAAIEALKSLSNIESVTLYTDSEYVLKGITEWVHTWQKKDWKTAAKKPVENQELWWALIKASEDKNVEWRLVRGHEGVEGNERCDVIATSFADREIVELYKGSREKYGINLEA
ncbi:ribonuclease HI [Candidatus Parcubacteria bacterium]|nr:ribonuclease HI [Candidatus Parcubacteria bacterium]